jgi:hypothetical protein
MGFESFVQSEVMQTDVTFVLWDISPISFEASMQQDVFVPITHLGEFPLAKSALVRLLIGMRAYVVFQMEGFLETFILAFIALVFPNNSHCDIINFKNDLVGNIGVFDKDCS